MTAVRYKTLEEAQARIEELEGLLYGPGYSLPRLALTRSEWIVFQLLMRREIISNEGIYIALYGGDQDRDPEITKIFIWKIRKKLGQYGSMIQTKWGMGYFITAEDKKKLQELMEAESASDAAAVAEKSTAQHAGCAMRAM